MPKRKITSRRGFKTLPVFIGSAAAVVLLVAGSLAWWAYSFVANEVHSELVAQQIYFPAKGSPALDPKEFPGLQQYAGQLVDNGPKAKAYANEFIAVHLKKVANGQTYAQVSSEAQNDPSNVKLQKEVDSLFKGETLRGLLLGDAYAFWTIGQIAKVAALVLLLAGALVVAWTIGRLVVLAH